MKTVLLTTILLVLFTLGVVYFRNRLLQQRETCGQHLLTVVGVALADYANEHERRLPPTMDELNALLGADASRYRSALDNDPLIIFRWKRGEPVPFLWDAQAHPFIGKVHVLYTDGTVIASDIMPIAPAK